MDGSKRVMEEAEEDPPPTEERRYISRAIYSNIVSTFSRAWNAREWLVEWKFSKVFGK